MKNKQKSRSGCRTCKLRRLRCDETKPGCRNCSQKGYDCPGYQQRLQWSTKHEKPTATRASGPANFTQLVTAASESIVSGSTNAAEEPSRDGTAGPAAAPTLVPTFTDRLTVPSFADRLVVPSLALSASASPSSLRSLSPSPSSSSSTSTSSPPSQHKIPSASVSAHVALVSVAPKTEPGWPNEHGQAPELTMVQPMVDIPTFLIEHWFKSVCSSWSALDSQSNPYRRLTANLWQTSTPVFYALQSISAASLVERLPHVMRDTARAAPRHAVDAINKELMAFFTESRPKFPTELLLSLFCMSSSMCWMEARQLGQHFVRQARAVLRKLDGWNLDSETRQLLDFFNGCLVYEEMLRSVVSEEEIDFKHMLSWPEPAVQRPLIPAVSHPWTGVSSDVLRLFGKAMALCRRSRTRWRHNNGTSYQILQDAMKDIEDATKVEEALLSVVVPQLRECTQPQQTPGRTQDLHYLTEAYRLCALLQLYETFPDLSSKRIPSLKDAEGPAVWRSWVSPLALHVTDVLSKVPPGSLSCIQPLLCLCAGSGLRYESKVPLGSGHRNYLLSTDPGTPTTPTYGTPDPDFHLPTRGLSEEVVKVSQARLVIMERLDQLELSLPPKPIEVAKKLQRAVWNAYDEEIELTRRTHWLDVMSITGLHSLFG